MERLRQVISTLIQLLWLSLRRVGFLQWILKYLNTHLDFAKYFLLFGITEGKWKLLHTKYVHAKPCWSLATPHS